jgi:hypothetical protein
MLAYPRRLRRTGQKSLAPAFTLKGATSCSAKRNDILADLKMAGSIIMFELNMQFP